MRTLFFIILAFLFVSGCGFLGPTKADLYVYIFHIGTTEDVDSEHSEFELDNKKYRLGEVLFGEGSYFTTVDTPFNLFEMNLMVNATITTASTDIILSFSATPVVLYHDVSNFATDSLVNETAYLLLDLKEKRVFVLENPVLVRGELTQEGSVVTLKFEDHEMSVPVYGKSFLFYLPRPKGEYEVNVFFDEESTSLIVKEGRDNYEIAF
ncbi:hypothetical protein [Thermotoga sp. KOL6]|uniref:hypothetical protein n=1 Tax=Thermotoga sp. KOL6 TaxID=126741 RepID=UPI000C767786|nr:hypothetical protein [Thermotoga sp. KOL6]PLV59242.1 hypothetical protein AS005_05740 [Thermotoga sp. KOL6]